MSCVRADGSQVHRHLGLQSFQDPDTTNGPTRVAVFVHELHLVLSRSQYTAILTLIFENFREPCPLVPAVRELPPPPTIEEITPGADCLKVPASVLVPVYFKSIVARLVEDATPFGGEPYPTFSLEPDVGSRKSKVQLKVLSLWGHASFDPHA